MNCSRLEQFQIDADYERLMGAPASWMAAPRSSSSDSPALPADDRKLASAMHHNASSTASM
jgi:hypothetical protein